MRKPWFVRLAGWVFCLSVLFFVLAFVSKRDSADNMALFVMMWLGFPLMGVSLVVWLVGSLVAWGLHRQGKQQAAIVRDILRREISSSVTPPLAESYSAVSHLPANNALACVICESRAAVLFCSVHRAPVCDGCVVGHDDTACSYVLATRVTATKPLRAAKRERVATSPLGLGSLA